MNRTSKVLGFGLIAGLIGGLLLLGCAQREVRPPAPAEMPDWCTMTSGLATDVDRGKVVVGVGSVSGIKSPTMARTNSDGAARTEIAKLFNTYAENMLSDYKDFTDEQGNRTTDEELTQATAIFSKMNVRRAPIEDRYVDEETNTWYSMAVLPFDQFLTLVQSNGELSDRLKAFFSSEGTKVCKELQAHEPK